MSKDECLEFLNKGHINEAGISLYVDKMLLEETDFIPNVLLEHVENCKKCKSEIIELYEICKNNPDYKTTIHVTFSEKEKSRFRINLSVLLKIAASIILVISLTFFIKYINIKNSLKKDIISKKELNDTTFNANELTNSSSVNISDSDISNKPVNKKQIHSLVTQNIKQTSSYISANYEIYPDFENLIEESFRSEFSLKILEPKTGQVLPLNKPIVFKWKGETDEKIRIAIFNNKAEKLYEIKHISDNQVILNKKLRPGLYYWKVETESDLVYLGKFVIK